MSALNFEAVETLLHAHDYIWDDKSRPVFERLLVCNILFERALALVPPEKNAGFLLNLFAPRQSL